MKRTVQELGIIIVSSLQLLFSKTLSFCCIFIRISVERLQFIATTLLYYETEKELFMELQKFARII